MIGWFQTISVQSFQPIFLIYRIYHNMFIVLSIKNFQSTSARFRLIKVLTYLLEETEYKSFLILIKIIVFSTLLMYKLILVLLKPN